MKWSSSHNWRVSLLPLLIIAISLYVRSDYVRSDGDLLLRYDPYYHYRMAKAIVEEGHRPEWDYQASWPTGEPVNHPPLYHYFLAYTFHIFGFLVNGNLLTWCVYSCSIPVIFFVVLAFLAGRELTDTAGGLFCSLLFAMTAYPIRRTLVGFADTDGFILVFALLITYFWIKSIPDRTLYSILAGFSVFLFEITWMGYWHILFLLMGASLMSVVYFMKKKVDFSQVVAVLLAFLIPHSLYSRSFVEAAVLIGAAALLFSAFHLKKRQQVASLVILVFCGFFLLFEGFFTFPFHYLGTGESFQNVEGVFYPYLGPYISQRKEVTVSFLVNEFTISLLLAPLGLFFLYRKKDERAYALCSFLVLYLAGGVLMMFLGVRFLLVLTVPLLLLSSAALSHVWARVAESTPGKKALVLCGILLLFVPVYVTAGPSRQSGSPIDDDWLNALQWVKENTPEDCVVITDWGEGHWVEAMADRKTVMNGMHYDIYWRLPKFGKMMETRDEETAVKEVFGFTSLEEVESLRVCPAGEKGTELKEKEMSPFVLPGQEAYLVLGSRNALTFDIISYFGTWDYTAGMGESAYAYGGVSLGTILQPRWKQHLFNTKEYQVAVYEADGFHSYVVKGNSFIPTEGTMYVDEGKTYLLKRENGSYGIAWYYSSSFMIFIPTESLDTMLVRLYFFNGEGLGHFELVADFGTVKVFRIHREFRENLNVGITVKEDQWVPA